MTEDSISCTILGYEKADSTPVVIAKELPRGKADRAFLKALTESADKFDFCELVTTRISVNRAYCVKPAPAAPVPPAA